MVERAKVVVIGAGFGGLEAAQRLVDGTAYFYPTRIPLAS
jgi:NADH dehydrogenase FAD-containing subunit